MLSDYEVLKAIKKGSYWLKLTKLRALGFVKGSIPKMEITPDGLADLERQEGLAEPQDHIKRLLKEARAALVAASGQEDTNGLFTLGRMNDEPKAVALWDRIGEIVRRIDEELEQP